MHLNATPVQPLDENQQVLSAYWPFTETHVLRELQKFYRVDATYAVLWNHKNICSASCAVTVLPLLVDEEANDSLTKECGITAL